MAWWKNLKKSTPEQEEEFQNMLEEEKVSWKDRLAMILAAYLTILLPCAVILIVLGLLLIWIFGGF
mgnify:CR=1 FL=1